MKKLAMVITVILISVGFLLGCKQEEAKAETLSISEQLQKLPALKQGIAFSLIDNEISYLSTIECLKWKGLTLEAGYSSKDKVVGVISYELLKLKNYIDLPILNLVELNLGIYGGYGRLNVQALDKSEWDAGISATLIKIKW